MRAASTKISDSWIPPLSTNAHCSCAGHKTHDSHVLFWERKYDKPKEQQGDEQTHNTKNVARVLVIVRSWLLWWFKVRKNLQLIFGFVHKKKQIQLDNVFKAGPKRLPWYTLEVPIITKNNCVHHTFASEERNAPLLRDSRLPFQHVRRRP